jgi:hypothetical protein
MERNALDVIESLAFDEYQVLKAMCILGCPPPALSKAMDIPFRTCSRYLKNIRAKLGVENNMQAVIYYYRNYAPALIQQWKQEQARLAPPPAPVRVMKAKSKAIGYIQLALPLTQEGA